MPLVSIIMPVFNGIDGLYKCVSSLKNQTLHDIEIIMVDDGSNDGSDAYCDKLACLDKRIKVVHQKNLGSAVARKIGLRQATGKYVTFVDVDDWIEQDLCACLFEAAERYQAELVIGEHFLDTNDVARRQRSILKPGWYSRNDLEEVVIPNLFHDDFYSGWSIYPYLCGKLFLRERLMPYMEYVKSDITLGDDVCVTFPYLLDAQSLVIVDKPLYHYVEINNSQSHGRMRPENLRGIRRVYELILASLQRQHCLEEEYVEKLRVYILTTMLVPRFPWLMSKLLNQGNELPFFHIRNGSKVIIYGAGVFGRALHEFLSESGFAEVILWLDARATSLRDEGYEVKTVQEVQSWPEYDFVIIPIMNKNIVKAVVKDLTKSGIVQERIRYLDEEYVKSEEVWQSFEMEAEDE